MSLIQEERSGGEMDNVHPRYKIQCQLAFTYK